MRRAQPNLCCLLGVNWKDERGLMMWGLHSLTNLNVVYYLPIGRTYTIGRKETDIIISDDPSVSRSHATITVQRDRVSISESKSKFGSKINGIKVTNDTGVHHNDVIQLGQGPTTLRLLSSKLTFCCSNMPTPIKKQLKTMAEQLGGIVVNDWTKSCTHLVMTSVTVTVKAVNALSACCPIVTPSWLEESIKCVKDKRVLPSSKRYQPSVVDDNLCVRGHDVSLDPSPERRHLFKNKRVYFLDNKQLTSLKYCIAATEGTTCLLSPDTPPDTYCHDDSIVIDPGSSSNRETVLKELTSHNLRFVTEAEVGHAVLLVSIDRFCNPKVLLDNPLSNPLPSGSLSQAPFSYQTQSTLYNTQQSDVTIFAQNTELSQMGGAVGGVKRPSGGITKVDETIIKQEPMDLNNSQFTVNNPLQTNMGVIKVKPDPEVTSQLTKTSVQVTSSISSSLNATILAMDSLPPFASPSFRNTSVNLPDEAIISSAFNNRKRDRNTDIENQQAGSNSKRLKPETQTTPVSDQHEELDNSVTNTNTTDNGQPPSPTPQATPFNKPIITNSDGFMSARKRTPVKSQTRTVERKKEKPGISPKRLRIDAQKDTENPLPTSNDHNTTTINNTIVQSGFISARRRPLVIQPVVKTEEKDTDIDFSLFPEPIVETNDLIKKQQPVSEIESQTKPGIVNYKRFRKAQNPECCSSFDRIIGGSDLSVYAIEVES